MRSPRVTVQCFCRSWNCTAKSPVMDLAEDFDGPIRPIAGSAVLLSSSLFTPTSSSYHRAQPSPTSVTSGGAGQMTGFAP